MVVLIRDLDDCLALYEDAEPRGAAPGAQPPSPALPSALASRSTNI